MGGGGLRGRLKDRTCGGRSRPQSSPYWPDQRAADRRLGVRGHAINSETTASTAGGEARPGLRLDLVLEPGERIEGHVTIVGETVGVPFKGWVEFMAAVDSLRTGHVREPDITVPVTGRTAEPARPPRRRRPG